MTFTGTLGEFTPYSSVTPLMSEAPLWAPESEQARIGSYQKYEELYWSNPTAFKLVQRGSDTNPIYVPNSRTVVDSTAHFLMKGMKLTLGNERDQGILDKFAKREQFYWKFHTAKHSGVVRGDYVFHLMANPLAAPSKRVSIESIDPGSYFPVWGPDHPDEMLGVDIVDIFRATNDEVRVLRQRYMYMMLAGTRRVTSELLLLEPEDWWDQTKKKIVKVLISEKLLPSTITTIPVYHFQNIGWQGQPYGSSELRGFERLLASVNQSASDEEVALALEGLGVYATDAPHPTDSDGEEVPWEISPGRVIETPSGAKFDRVAGVGTIKPMQDHISYLEQSLYEASGTFRPANIDVAVAESGIALAIKFLPTLAKVDHREEAAKALMQQMMFDWGRWEAEYENEHFSGEDGVEVEIALDDKLPKDPVARLNELNNMADRGIISHKYYRQMMTEEFGYVFPDNLEDEILAEKTAALELAQKFTPKDKGVSDQTGIKNRGTKRSNRSNNRNRSNESGGTEAK